MKKLYRLSAGVLFALAVPVVLSFFTSARGVPATPAPASGFPPQPPVRYATLAEAASAPLPEHALLLTMEQGDTLESALRMGGVERATRAFLIREIGLHADLRRLGAGHLVRVHYDETSAVDAVQLKLRGWGQIDAVRTSGGFSVTPHPAPQHEVERVVSGEIGGSLYEALRMAGEGAPLVRQIASVFESEIDFFRLRKNDSFSIMTRRTYAGEDPAGPPKILAARFVHRGESFEAFRYEPPGGTAGYYMRDGTPLRAQFLRAPLSFVRITSRFTNSRFDPIFHSYIPHHGVDYGAPVGTPVMTTADGVVLKAERGSGTGNYVRVRHAGSIETSYLHLSRFAKGIVPGKRVRQGEVIGYVGATGLATGPHLDYRVFANGKWIDPLTLKSVRAEKLRGPSLKQFLAAIAPLQSKLAATVPAVAALTANRSRRALF